MLFIPRNSCDFPICRVFFVCFFFDVEKWNFSNREKILPYLNVPKVQRRLKIVEHQPGNQIVKKIQFCVPIEKNKNQGNRLFPRQYVLAAGTDTLSFCKRGQLFQGAFCIGGILFWVAFCIGSIFFSLGFSPRWRFDLGAYCLVAFVRGLFAGGF